MANTKGNKSGKQLKTENSYRKLWWPIMVQKVCFSDPESLNLLIEKRLSLPKNPIETLGLALSTIFKLMRSYAKTPDDFWWIGKYANLLRKIKGEPTKLNGKHYKNFPSLNSFYQELPKNNDPIKGIHPDSPWYNKKHPWLPKSIEHLKRFYATGKAEHYHMAVKEGLFRELVHLAHFLSSHSEKFPEKFAPPLKEFISLMDYALHPIMDWSNQVILNDDKTVSVKAKLNLQRTGEMLTPLSTGRRRKFSSEASPFSDYQSVMVCILYGIFYQEFKRAKAYKNLTKRVELLEKRLGRICSGTDLDKLSKIEPNLAAKKLLCKHFDLGERTLNSILAQRELLAVYLD